MDGLDFTEDEIREQLSILGYRNIPTHRLREFKQDLDELIRHGEWRGVAPNATGSPTAGPSKPSPPAVIKEKVSQTHGYDSGPGFFLHAGDRNRDVLAEPGRRLERWDSYAQHSVAPKLQLPPGAPSMLQVETDPDDTLPSLLTDSHTSTPDTRGRRFIRRKVLRKHEGQSLVCDESVYSEDSDLASSLDDRLSELHVSPPARREFEAGDDDTMSRSDAPSSGTEGTFVRDFEFPFAGMARAQRDKPKSFIRPVTHATKKTDPVTKYYQYKRFWEMFKLPGEKERKDLRLEIKERLEYQPPLPKPRRVFVPNTYVVPTEKKRSELRWQIRNDLANGLVPYKFSYLL